MFASSWLRQLQRRWFVRRAIRHTPIRWVRPCLEVLEDRTAPAVLTVNSLQDIATPIDNPNSLTLREALRVVNTGSTAGLSQSQLNQINTTTNPLGSDDTIIFDPSLTANGPATIDLSIDGDDTFGPSALLVTAPVSILGPSGGNGLTLTQDATNGMRLFYVTSGGNLTLENLTLSGGLAQGGSSTTGGGAAGLGGAVVNAGSLTLLDDTVSGNQAIGGSSGVTVAFGGGGLGGNSPFGTPDGGPPNGGGEGDAGGFGGGGGSVGNGGFGGGGGNGDSTVAAGAGGFGGGTGGSNLEGGGGGAGMGGAVFNYGGSLTITNSTLSGNTAQGGSCAFIGGFGTGSGGSGYGGAVFNLNGTVTVTYSTLADNTVTAGKGSTNGDAAGGAIYNLGDDGVATQDGPALPSTQSSYHK